MHFCVWLTVLLCKLLCLLICDVSLCLQVCFVSYENDHLTKHRQEQRDNHIDILSGSFQEYRRSVKSVKELIEQDAEKLFHVSKLLMMQLDL